MACSNCLFNFPNLESKNSICCLCFRIMSLFFRICFVKSLICSSDFFNSTLTQSYSFSTFLRFSISLFLFFICCSTSEYLLDQISFIFIRLFCSIFRFSLAILISLIKDIFFCSNSNTCSSFTLKESSISQSSFSFAFSSFFILLYSSFNFLKFSNLVYKSLTCCSFNDNSSFLSFHSFLDTSNSFFAFVNSCLVNFIV
ncbi:hypothetical protein HOG21_07460 [bacterium]|nr:hypothetical protein [bacterium]